MANLVPIVTWGFGQPSALHKTDGGTKIIQRGMRGGPMVNQEWSESRASVWVLPTFVAASTGMLMLCMMIVIAAAVLAVFLLPILLFKNTRGLLLSLFNRRAANGARPALIQSPAQAIEFGAGYLATRPDD
jgi:hypothetical protein